MRDPNYPAHPFRPGIEVVVTKEAPDKHSHFVLCHAHHSQAVVAMPEVWLIETHVAGEKGRLALLAQQDYDCVVFQAFSA